MAISDMVSSVVTYSGWRFDEIPVGQKITGDYPTTLEAAAAIQAYARNLGLQAQNIEFVMVKETLSRQALTKTVFTITTTTSPIT